MSDKPHPNTHSSARCIYKISEDLGRGYGVQALFTAHPEDVANLVGREIWFGEICGEDSDVFLEIKPGTIQEIEAPTPEVIRWLESNIGHHCRTKWTPCDSWTLSGHNPFEMESSYEESEDV